MSGADVFVRGEDKLIFWDGGGWQGLGKGLRWEDEDG